MPTNEKAPSLEELVQQQYEENQRKAAEAAGEKPPIQAAQGDFNLNVAGKSYSFKSVEEMNNFVNQTLAATQQQAQQVVEAATRNLPGTRMTADEASRAIPKPDLREFAKLLDENPADAFNYIDRFRFGTDNVAGLLQNIATRQMAQEQVLAAYQFRDMHPEFERTPENAEALARVMQGYNLPTTVDGLEMAYAVATKQGLIKEKQDEKVEETQYQEPAYRATPPPPRVGRTPSGNFAPDYMSMAEDLDPDQLLKVINTLEGGR